MRSQLQVEDDIFVGKGEEKKKADDSNDLLDLADRIWILQLRPSRLPVINSAAPLIYPEISIVDIAPRRKVVWVWICCVCGYGGMKVSVDPCPNCCNPRCPNCDTRRINTRSH